MNDLEHARQHFMAGLEEQKAGRITEAEARYRKAEALVPGRVSIMTNLAAVLIEQNRFSEARSWCEKVLGAEPENSDGLLNLSLCLLEEGATSKVRELLDQALINTPLHTGALCNRAALAMSENRINDALRDYTQALSANPLSSIALAGRGSVQLRQGQPRNALASFKLALRHTPGCIEAERGFVMALQCDQLTEADYDQEVEALALQLFQSPRFRPELIAHALRGRLYARTQFRRLLERVETSWPQRLVLDVSSDCLLQPWRDPLLIAILETTPLTDIAIERLLVTLRYRLLQQACTGKNPTDLAFHCALARQCFINEYIYPQLPEEADQVDRLCQQLQAAIEAGRDVPDAWIAAIASYSPLHTIGRVRHLADGKTRCAPIEALITQQIHEPLAEHALRETLERLTPIDDRISRKVQQQYEENPYPRWTRPAMSARKNSFAGWLATRIGRNIGPHHSGGEINALTAGCGTGRQVVETATQIAGVRLLAVDLSTASLAFAKRKADEYGLPDIRFAQADILCLGTLNQRFDFIDSTGVLHHMQDPSAGLSVLAGLLKDDGVMRLALYSETARNAVVAVRQKIAETKASDDPESIRQLRQQLMNLPKNAAERAVVQFADFYSLSECRDLLFHVQESRYSLPGIVRLLDGAGLRFISFELDPSQLAKFQAAFPAEQSLADLGLWNEFERRNPDFFASMYQFWVCKKAWLSDTISP